MATVNPGSDVLDRWLKQYEGDKRIKELWRPLLEDAYQYTLPGRSGFYTQQQAQRRAAKIFDSTAVQGCQDYAGLMQAGLTPNFAVWALLEPGTDVPEAQKREVQRKLESVTQFVFQTLWASNFATESYETYVDFAVSTGALLIEEGDAHEPIKCTAVPLTEVTIGNGPYQDVGRITRERAICAGDIPIKYSGAKLPKELADLVKDKPNEEVILLECVWRRYVANQDETWDYKVVHEKTKTTLLEHEWRGRGSSPWIILRNLKAAGEPYGRGPAINLLSTIKTANAVVELVLENAEMSIAGMWQTDDENTANPDVVQLVPGTIITTHGVRGLQPLTPGGKFQVADLVLNDLRTEIKKGFHSEPLGDPNKTPYKAAEANHRMAEYARRNGSTFGRGFYEFVQRVVERVVYILRKRGLIKLPEIDGRAIKVTAISPLARQQNLQDVEAITQTAQIIGATFGPQMLNLVLKAEEAAETIAERLGAPKRIIRSTVEREQLAKMLATLAQKSAEQGNDPLQLVNNLGS